MNSVCQDSPVYPPQLAKHLSEKWAELNPEQATVLNQICLTHFLEVLYLASFLQEERESVRCRVILADPEDWKQGEGPPGGFHVLRFASPRPFSPEELRKLAGAASYHRAVLGIHFSEQTGLQIWGIIETGPRWVNRVDGGRYHGAPLPPHLVGHVLGPGHILTACGYQRLVELDGGVILDSGFDPFKSVWLSSYFKSVRAYLLETLAKTKLEGARVNEAFIKFMAQNTIRRAISLVRSRKHGGMLIYMPTRLLVSGEYTRWLRIRCPFDGGVSTRHFGDLMLRAMERLALVGHRHGREEVSWQDYQELDDPLLAEVDESFLEMAHLFANLMSADGALVLSCRFDVIGFGAEVLGEGVVHEVHRALNLEATQTVIEPADISGTRHRSAYRLISAVPDSMAIVISQDSFIRFVANRENEVIYWPYSP